MITVSPTHALLILRQSDNIQDSDTRMRIERWAVGELDRNPSIGSAAVREMWEGALDAGVTNATAIWVVGQGHSSVAIGLAIEEILSLRPGNAVDPLRMIISEAMLRIPRPSLEHLTDAALRRNDLPSRVRALWSLLHFGLKGEAARSSLEGHSEADLKDLLEATWAQNPLDALPSESDAERASRAAAMVRALGPTSMPEATDLARRRAMRPKRGSDSVERAIRDLQQNADPLAGKLIAECLRTPTLSYWFPVLLHAKSAQSKLQADKTYTPPRLSDVVALLAGGPPINAQDLRAIVVDELSRLGRNLREQSESPWLDYWNTDSDGKPANPKIENVARNTTLTKLRGALEKYQIAVTLPEVQRKDSTRVDLYFATHNGSNLPIEAKRHYHKDLWTAGEGQLQGYTTSEGATGVGILLVFWFGADWTKTTSRPGLPDPADATELGQQLVEALPRHLREFTDVVVLDVSRPGGGESEAEWKKRRKAPSGKGVAAAPIAKPSKRKAASASANRTRPSATSSQTPLENEIELKGATE